MKKEVSKHQEYLEKLHTFLASQVCEDVHREGDVYITTDKTKFEYIKAATKEIERSFEHVKRKVHFDEIPFGHYAGIKLTYTPVYKRIISKKLIGFWCDAYLSAQPEMSDIINAANFENDKIKLYELVTERRIRYSYHDFENKITIKNQYNVGIATVIFSSRCTLSQRDGDTKKVDRRECSPNVLAVGRGVLMEMGDEIFTLYEMYKI